VLASWLHALSQHHAIAYAIVLIALVIADGLAAGNLKFRGIGLGGSGVLFVGILLGHVAPPPAPDALDFAKEFGLVLGVFILVCNSVPTLSLRCARKACASTCWPHR